MWILQRLLVVLAIAAILLFGMLNAGESVTVHYWFGEEGALEHSPLPLVMAIGFLVGVFFHYFIAMIREWRLRAEIRRLRRNERLKDQELTELRNLSLEEDLVASGQAANGAREVP
jgi:uncharacterized integral membrane protein